MMTRAAHGHGHTTDNGHGHMILLLSVATDTALSACPLYLIILITSLVKLVIPLVLPADVTIAAAAVSIN